MSIKKLLRNYALSLAFIFLIAVPSFETKAEMRQQGGRIVLINGSIKSTTAYLYKKVLSNFTYIKDTEGEDNWNVYDGNFPFAGDCEDFAFTLQYMVKAGSVFLAYLNFDHDTPYDGSQEANHAIFAYDGWYWDLSGKVYDLEYFEKAGHKIFLRFGDVTMQTSHRVSY